MPGRGSCERGARPHARPPSGEPLAVRAPTASCSGCCPMPNNCPSGIRRRRCSRGGRSRRRGGHNPRSRPRGDREPDSEANVRSGGERIREDRRTREFLPRERVCAARHRSILAALPIPPQESSRPGPGQLVLSCSRAGHRPRRAGWPPSRVQIADFRVAAPSATTARAARPASASGGGRLDGHESQLAVAVEGRVTGIQSGRSTTCHSRSPASTSLTVQPRVDWPASCTVSRLPETR